MNNVGSIVNNMFAHIGTASQNEVLDVAANNLTDDAERLAKAILKQMAYTGVDEPIFDYAIKNVKVSPHVAEVLEACILKVKPMHENFGYNHPEISIVTIRCSTSSWLDKLLQYGIITVTEASEYVGRKKWY